MNKKEELKKLNYNYYNVIYKFYRFHNKNFYFVDLLNNKGIFFPLNYISKLYSYFHSYRDLSLFHNSFGNLNLEHNIIDRKNLNFINLFNINKRNFFILKIFINDVLKSKIANFFESYNVFLNLNNIFISTLFVNNIKNDFQFFNYFLYYIKKHIIKKFQIIILLKFFYYMFFKFFLKNNLLSINYFLKNNFIDNKLFFKRFYYIYKNILSIFVENRLIYGKCLKSLIYFNFKSYLSNSDIKLPIYARKILYKNANNIKLNYSLKKNIFYIYNKNKKYHLVYNENSYLLFSFLKKYFLIFNKLSSTMYEKKIFDEIFNFFHILLINSQKFLIKFLNKDIDFNFFYYWKFNIYDSLLDSFEFEKLNIFGKYFFKKPYERNILIFSKKYRANKSFFFVSKIVNNIFFYKFAYEIFKLEKEKYSIKNFNINFINLKFEKKIYIMNKDYYLSFIFNTLYGKEINTFKAFCKRINLNLFFLSNISKSFFNNIKYKILEFNHTSMYKYEKMVYIAKKLIYLNSVDFYLNLKYKNLYYLKFFNSLYFSFFKIFIKLKYNNLKKKKYIKTFLKYFKSTIKTFFKLEKIELFSFKNLNKKSLNLNKVLKYIEFSNEITKNPYYFKINKIACLSYSKILNKAILYKKKLKIVNLNMKLIKIFFNGLRFFNNFIKKKLFIWIIFNIYMNGLTYIFYILFLIRYKKLLIERKLKKKRAIAVLKKKKYTIKYFKKLIKKNPNLLQTFEFNRKIVKYRAEPIFRTMDPYIRPNPYLKKIIWEWIYERNRIHKLNWLKKKNRIN